MNTLRPFTRVCVLLPRMSDDHAAYHDPTGEGAAWANRLFGATGLDHILDFRENVTVVGASCEPDLMEARMRINHPCQSSRSTGVIIIQARLADRELDRLDPERFQFLEVMELAMENLSVAEIARVIECLPFKTYRIERRRTAPLAEAEMLGFDWRPELPGLQDRDKMAA